MNAIDLRSGLSLIARTEGPNTPIEADAETIANHNREQTLPSPGVKRKKSHQMILTNLQSCKPESAAR
jgi:hypothetical protein